MSTRNLGNLVVRLGMELAQYKAGWKEAEDITRDGAAKVDQANQGAAKGADVLKDALKRQAGAYGEAAGGALELGQAATAATGISAGLAVGLGAAAVAAGALGYAAYQGAKEQQTLNNSLLLTGNYAGLVSGQLDQMALSVASSIGGTVGNAREVLAGLVGTGRFTVESLGEVSQAVQLVAQYSGQTNAQVLKDFAGMANGVAKWAEKSNEAYHFLTLETYRYIKALEEQGDKQQAMQVTSEALSKHLGGDLTQNLGWLEQAWNGITRAASGAWAAMKDVGKTDSLGEKIAAFNKAIEQAQGGLAAQSPGGSSRIRAMEQQRDALLALQAVEVAEARVKSEAAQASEKAIKAEGDWGRIIDANLTRAQRMQKEITAMRRAGEQNGRSAAEMAEQEEAIRARFAEKKRKGLTEAEKEAEKERRLLAELSGVQASYMEDLSRLNRLRQEGTLSEEQYVAAVTKLIEKQPMAKALMKAQADETERLAKANEAAAKAHESHVSELTKGIDKLEKEVDAQRRHNETLGLSKVAIAELDAAKLEEHATSLEGIAIRKMEKDLDEGLYDLRMREAAQLRQLASLKRQGAARETAIDDAKAAAKAWGETGEFIERALYDGVQEGLRDGENFAKAFFKSLAATAKTTVLRFGVQMVGQGLTGMVGSVMGGGNAAQAGSVLGNLGSLGGLLGGMGTFGGGLAAGFGGLTGSIGSLFGMAGTGATLGGALSAGTTALGVGNIMGGLGTLAGALGPIALGVAGIAAMFSGKGGGPKTEGGYAPAGLDIRGLDIGGNLQGSQRGDVANAQAISQGISGTYEALARQLGLVNQKLDVGIFYAMDNAEGGDSLTQLQVASGSYNRATRTGGIENVARGEEGFKAALAEETTRVIFEALKASDLAEQYKAWLNAVAADAGVGEMQAAIDRITRVKTERSQLEALLFELTATDLEKLNRTRDAERVAIDESNLALLEQVYAQQDLKAATEEAARAASAAYAAQAQLLDDDLTQLRGNTDEAYAALERAVGAQRTLAEAARDAAREQAVALGRLMDTLRSNIASLYGEVDSTRAMQAQAGQQFITDALSTALASGYLPDADALGEAVSAARAGMDNASSAFEANRDRLVLAGKLGELERMAGKQKSVAEHQLNTANAELQRLAGVLQAARDQIDVLRGIDTSVLSVEAAIDRLTAAILAEKAGARGLLTGSATEQWVDGPYGKAWTSTGGAVGLKNQLGLQIYGLQSTFTGAEAVNYVNANVAAGDALTVYQRALAEGISANSLDALMKWAPGASNAEALARGLPAFAAGGDHAGGWAMVGERGPELAYMPPARIYDAQDTRSMLAGGSDPEVVKLLRENQRLYTEMILRLQHMDARLKKFDKVGMPPARAAA